ncbi:uncharacterized protein [Antedon mediterranea]|uniref:uncharacterized protein n=1 Tax=Antedon mediterranea TaxID=105859 RepID=UPI003AF56085
MNIFVFAVLIISSIYLQVNCDKTTAIINTYGSVLYECNLQNITQCEIKIDVRTASVLHWSLTQFNKQPPIRDNSDVKGLFIVLHSWNRESGVYTSIANIPELELPSGKGTLTFSYYMWDLNEPVQLEYPKLKVFACGNETRAIWKRTGDKLDRWITTNIYLNCQESFKIYFEATVNGSNCGVALDDIVVRSGHVLTEGPTTQSPITADPSLTKERISSLTSQNSSAVTTNFPDSTTKDNDSLIVILIGIIIGLVFIIIMSVIIHCCLLRRNRRKKKVQVEIVAAETKRKRFQESKSGLMTTSGYMTLTKPKEGGLNNSAELGAIDLTSTPKTQQGIQFQQRMTPIERGKSLPRLPSLPKEAKEEQPYRHSVNIDATYEDVDDIPDCSLSRNSPINHNLTNTDSPVSPVYFTLSPADQTYSQLSEYATMPDVVRNADDNGLAHQPSFVAKNNQRRKSSLSSLRDKLSKGLSNASNDYEELKHDEEYYEVLECQM